MAGELGAYQQDAVQTGISSIYTEPMGGEVSRYDCIIPYGNVYRELDSSDHWILQMFELSKDVPQYRYIINQRTANETRPSNISIRYGIYLGRPAEI